MSLLRSKPQRIAAGVVLVAMGGIGFVPLFGGPGYEHALASGLLVPSAAAIATALDLSRARSPVPSPLACVGRGLASGALLYALSLLTALLHGLRVGLCDLWGGLAYDALTAGIGALLGGLWGALVAEVARGRTWRRVTGVLLALAAPIGGIVVSLLRFYRSPMIFAFDPFVGYFSGTLYDTVIEPGVALLSYRAGSLATIGGVVLVASVLTRNDGGTLRPAPLRGHPEALARVAVGASLLAVSAGVTLEGDRLDHWHTTASIAEALGGRRAGGRCDILHPDSLRADEVALLVKDCDEEIASLERRLGTQAPGRITAIFFRDAAEKKRLMGAADTYIAKPWRHEVYLQVGSYPHRVLGHELAHVLAGTFGRGPFRIAGDWGGLWPNPGLIEGTAVAASPDDDDLTDAQWARAMMDLGILPPMRSIFSVDFLGQNSAKSYTLAGAFVRYVLDRYGSTTLRAWYGGGSIEGLTGKSWATLDADFREELRRLPLLPDALAFAKAKFERPGVFGRRCPHVVDALRREADGCRDDHRVDRAIALYGDALARDPHDYASAFARGVLRLRYGDAETGRRDLAGMAADPALPRTWRDRIEEAFGDDDFLAGRYDAAEARYRAIAARSVDEDAARTLEVKALGARTPAARDAVQAMLIGAPGRPADGWLGALLLGAWGARGEDPLADYLAGKNLAQHAWYERAAERLDRALAEGAPTPRIGRELLRSRAVIACALGDAAAVQRMKAEVARDDGPFAGSGGGRREWVEQLLDRCSVR